MNMQIDMDSRALKAAFDKAPQKVVGGIRDWVNRSAARAVRVGTTEAPFSTGNLNRSIHANFAKQGLEAKVKPTANYAHYVHEGTGIYGPKKRPITPRSASVLAFSVGGQMVFAKSVKGQKANPFMKRAYDKVKPEVERDATRTLDSIVRSI